MKEILDRLGVMESFENDLKSVMAVLKLLSYADMLSNKSMRRLYWAVKDIITDIELGILG